MNIKFALGLILLLLPALANAQALSNCDTIPSGFGLTHCLSEYPDGTGPVTCEAIGQHWYDNSFQCIYGTDPSYDKQADPPGARSVPEVDPSGVAAALTLLAMLCAVFCGKIKSGGRARPSR